MDSWWRQVKGEWGSRRLEYTEAMGGGACRVGSDLGGVLGSRSVGLIALAILIHDQARDVGDF